MQTGPWPISDNHSADGHEASTHWRIDAELHLADVKDYGGKLSRHVLYRAG